MASAPFAAFTKFFHKQPKHVPVQSMHDDDRIPDVVGTDYEPYLHPHLHPFANANEFDHWSPPHTQIHIPDHTVTTSSSSSAVLAGSSLAQGTATTRAHIPRPPATAARAKQGEYIPSHRQQLQQQLAIVTQPSAATQPVLFDFDMDAEWHQTGAQFEAQQQQQFALNLGLNNPSLSPASSFSSLSPTQVPIPLAPGIPGVPPVPQQLQQQQQQHGAPPLSTASMSPTSNTTPSASTSLPTYSFPSASPYVPHNSLRRTATSNAMPPSPASPSQSYHQQHQRHASANGYHPYAPNGRYQGHQQQHRRSPLHQQQSSRSSPLGHQPGYVAEDFVDPSYGGQQMARSQGAVQGGYPVQQQGYGPPPPFEQSIQKQYPQQSYPFPSQQQQQQQQPRLSPSLYPSPPPSHPHLQHLQRVHIPAYTGPVGHGHGPRSASSSSTSSHVTSNSSNSSAASSYGPGTPLSVGSSAGSFPSSSSLAGLNLNGNASNSNELLAEMMIPGPGVCVPDDGSGMVQAATQHHFVGLSGGMGIVGMGMDVDGMGVVVDPLELEMGMGYMNPSQPQQQHSPSVHSQTTGISPQLVMLDSMPNHIHDQAQPMSSIFDDEPSPIDAAYAEYAAASAAVAAAGGESYVMGVGVSGGDVDPRDSISNLDDGGSELGGMGPGGVGALSSPLTQQRLEQHQQEEQRKAARPEVTAVQEWQRLGREYDSADSDSESEGSEEEDDEDYEEERNGSEVEVAKEEEAPLVTSPEQRQVGARRGGKTKASNARGSTHAANGTGAKTPSNNAAKPASKTPRQAPSSFRRAVPTKRASTRTITPATIKTSRSRASTQTLTQKNVRSASGTVPQEKSSTAAVDMGEAEGEMDAEGEADLDAEGEEDVGEGEMDIAANGEGNAAGEDDLVHDSAEEDDEDMSTDESSDYDDDKDGEFILRPRSRSRPSASRAPRRAAGESASAKRGTGGRMLRTRTSSGNGSASGRYNPYSAYANDQASSPVASNSSSISGLRTLSSTLANAGVLSGVAPSSPTLSSSSLSNAGDVGSSKQRKPRPPTNLPVPVPVPNLTKKSRGRRVPTVGSLEELRKVNTTNESASTSGAGTGTSGGSRGRRKAGASSVGTSTGTKGSRMYLCDVEGCGKCFARGEHLKRHVRSIHTNEKPHTCPYPGCGKDFSRHDNLGQHMRVHKDYAPPPSAKAST